MGIVGELSPRKEQSRSRKVPQAIYVASKFSILNARDTVHFNQGNGTLGISVSDVGEMTLHRSMIYIQDAEEEVRLCYGEQATNVASTFMLRILVSPLCERFLHAFLTITGCYSGPDFLHLNKD